MYLSGTISETTEVIGASGSTITNGGTYWNAFTVDDTYEPWYRTVYADDHPITAQRVPSHIAVNSVLDNESTVIVEQTERGTAPAGSVLSAGSIAARANEPVYIEEPVVAKYFRVRTINGAASNATLNQSIRLKDKYT